MSANQRIAFLCHPYHRGGATRWMADAALAFAKKGVEVYFLTVEPAIEFFSGKGRETLLQLLDKEENTVRIIKTKVGREFEFGTAEYRAYVYRKLIKQLPLGTPIILSDDSTVWEAAALLHLSYPIIGVLHADEDVYYDFAKKYSDRVQVLICVSQRVRKNAILKVPEIDQAHLFTIPCGINLPDINHTTQAGNILRLVYVGRVLHYQKRAGDLVRICELLDNQKVPFHLNIIGHGDALPAIKEGLKKTGLDKHVTFPGWLTQKEVAKYLSESDVLVLTSDFEGTPIAMMEALASGCGFTGTRVSGIEDYEHNPLAADCYSVFTVGDIEDAVNKIRKVAAIPPNTRSMAARALAETEFSMAVCLERYQAAIATLKPAEAQAPKISLSLSQLLYSRAIAVARYLKMSIRS